MDCRCPRVQRWLRGYYCNGAVAPKQDLWLGNHWRMVWYLICTSPAISSTLIMPRSSLSFLYNLQSLSDCWGLNRHISSLPRCTCPCRTMPLLLGPCILHSIAAVATVPHVVAEAFPHV